MQTEHRVLCADAAALPAWPDGSAALMVTSPPYPMIAMWDGSFAAQSGEAARALAAGESDAAFEAMHAVLDRVWREADRLLCPGGMACVNIGDATRSDGGGFRLFSNRTRVISAFSAMGYQLLPDIVWRKPTNAPNKFMGSGMLPPGAYVTFEHEAILLFRKGPARAFAPSERANRRRSAYFWEERNRFFSDLWELRGTGQRPVASRGRSAAFPYEIARRLVLMFSVQNDCVLDPFAGTLTTALACMETGRSSLSAELSADLVRESASALSGRLPFIAEQARARLAAHAGFVRERTAAGDTRWYHNTPHGFAVKTRQETELCIPVPADIAPAGAGRFICRYTLPGEG